MALKSRTAVPQQCGRGGEDPGSRHPSGNASEAAVPAFRTSRYVRHRHIGVLVGMSSLLPVKVSSYHSDGSYRPVTVIAPEGGDVNLKYPARVGIYPSTEV